MIDLLIVFSAAAMAYVGYRRGAVVSLVGVLGIAAGGGFGALVGGLFGDRGTLFGVLVGAMGVGIVLSQHIERLQELVEDHVGDGIAHQVDRALGAALNTLVALSLAWFVGIVFALVPKSDRLPAGEQMAPGQGAVERSALIDLLLGVVSPTGPVAVEVLRSGLVPATGGPLIIVDAPEDSVLGEPGVQRASASVVRIVGEACDDVTTGTGWVAAPRLVVTNAHVVAGHESTLVVPQGLEREDGIEATLVGFDPGNDIAVLHVPGLARVPLQMHPSPVHGDRAAIVGYPRTEGLVFGSARFDRTLRYPVKDIYNRATVDTHVSVFRGDVRPGNSGSPILAADGRLIATVTSNAVSQAIEGGYAVPNTVVQSVLGDLHPSVGSGPCIEQVGEAAAVG